MPEQPDQARVDALRDVAIALHQARRIGVEESRIGPHEPREFGEGPLKPGGRDHAVHRRADAPHLGEPQLVDLLGREGRGCELPHPQRVPRGAVRQGAHGHGLARAREVRAGEIVAQPAVGRRDALRVGRDRRGREPRSLYGANRRREVREGLEQRTRERAVGDQLRDLLRHVA